ncbi:MAG: cupin domain-containing protein [Pseudarthrobacter sp.]
MTAGNHTLIAANAEALLAALPVDAGAVRSTRVFKGAGAGVVRLTIDEGAVMREHTATAPILLQVLSGHAALDVGGERVDLPTGAIIHLDAGQPHSVEALTPAHLLLIICERAPGTTRAHRLDRPVTVDASAAASTPEPEPEPARRSNLVLASSGPDSDAVERVTARHAELTGSAASYATQLIDAAASGTTSKTANERHRG